MRLEELGAKSDPAVNNIQVVAEAGGFQVVRAIADILECVDSTLLHTAIKAGILIPLVLFWDHHLDGLSVYSFMRGNKWNRMGLEDWRDNGVRAIPCPLRNHGVTRDGGSLHTDRIILDPQIQTPIWKCTAPAGCCVTRNQLLRVCARHLGTNQHKVVCRAVRCIQTVDSKMGRPSGLEEGGYSSLVLKHM